MAQNRVQHYIPQFYLKKFVDEIVESPKTPYLWVFSRNSNEIKNKAPHNVAFGNGFYDFKTDDGKVSVELEDSFKKLEYKSAKILNKIISKQQYITSDEKITFSEFVYFMNTRVPHFRNNINNFTSEISKKMLNIAGQHPEYIERILNEIHKKNGEIEQDHDITGITEFINSDRYSIEVPQEMSMKYMVELSKDIIPIINSMSWEFLIAPKNIRFITSDNPVVLKDPFNKSKFFGDGFMSSKTVEMTFPLSPQICLLGVWKKFKSRFRQVSSAAVREINLRTSNSSTLYVFSSKKIVDLPSGLFQSQL